MRSEKPPNHRAHALCHRAYSIIGYFAVLAGSAAFALWVASLVYRAVDQQNRDRQELASIVAFLIVFFIWAAIEGIVLGAPPFDISTDISN